VPFDAEAAAVRKETTSARRWPPIQVETYTPDFPAYKVSADAIGANEVLFPSQTVSADNPDDPPVQRRAFCQICTFLTWGAWGARSDYQKGDQTVTNDVNLGWWIAGETATKEQMPTTGNAAYSGDAIGNVDSDGQQYVATGAMDMSWNFGRRSGTLSISEFDGKDFSGRMIAPGRAEFAGALTGSGGLIGEANGAFVGPTQLPNNLPGFPQGVIGNFGVGNSTWQATGIFGGTVVPQ
jgi:hypothetical protein